MDRIDVICDRCKYIPHARNSDAHADVFKRCVRDGSRPPAQQRTKYLSLPAVTVFRPFYADNETSIKNCPDSLNQSSIKIYSAGSFLFLIFGTDGATAFYAGSAHIGGFGMSADDHFLSLKVRPEHSFGGFVGMTVGMPCDGPFSA